MEINGKRIILGSHSPRRRELLAALDIDFAVDERNSFEEKTDPSVLHESMPVLMAEGKSMGFWRELQDDEILITADTMVLCGNDILGKPADREDAARMLKMLSGKEHSVITAVVVRDKHRSKTLTDRTYVRFRDLSDSEIYYYIDKYKPFDKAGSYGVQEWIGYVGIESIRGSFYNVMGLPVHKLYPALLEFVL